MKTNGVETFTGAGGLLFFRLRHGAAEAEITLHGAHVTHYRPAGAEPVLFVSPSSLFEEGKAIRGGIPVCAPWFAAHPSMEHAPMHGLVRSTLWQLAGTRVEDDGVAIAMRFESAGGKEFWPSPFTMELELELGEQLSVRLDFQHLGSEAVRYSSALHSYFAVSDSREVAVAGLEGVEYLDKTTGFTRCLQSSDPVVFHGEVDRIYLNTPSSTQIVDPKMGRRIVVEKEGSLSTVIWNPGPDKAAAMADLGLENQSAFVCVETANAAENTVELSAKGTHRLVQRIRVET